MEGIIEVIDPGLNPVLYIIFGAILLVGIALMGLGLQRNSEGAVIIGTLLTLGGAIFGAIVPPVVYDSDIQAAQVAALEAAGFSSVKLDYGNSFVAETADGEFFEGEIIHLDGNNWQVIEYVEVNGE